MSALGAEDVPIKVSVVTITYNQRDYIEQALDSFLAQEVDFGVEFVVSDDASTDGTAEIVAAYAEKHPGLFRPILRRTNVGIHANLREALQATRGSYIALCEGDDYWTDPRKLERQVSFLDAAPDAALVFHPVEIMWQDQSGPDEVYPPESTWGELTLDALLRRNLIQTNAVMYRRLEDYAAVPDRVMPLDWFVHILHARRGRLGFIPQVMSVYRRHEGGIWWGSVTNEPDFWVEHGYAQAALVERLLELFEGMPEQISIIGIRADNVVRKIVQVTDELSGSGLGRFAAEAPLAARHATSSLMAELAEALGRSGRAEAKLEDASLKVGQAQSQLNDARAMVARQRARINRLRSRIKAKELEAQELRSRLPAERIRGVASRLRSQLGRSTT